MTTTIPDDFWEDVAHDVAAALSPEAATIVEAKQRDLGVPAGSVRGPRGGLRTVASRPGEPPRKRTGRLQAGMVADVTQAGLVVTLRVNDPVSYAVPLENSGRVITSDVDARFGERVLDVIATAISGDPSQSD